MAKKKSRVVHMGEPAEKQESFGTVCGRFITLRLVWTINPAHVTCPECLRVFLDRRCCQIKELKDAVNDSESRRRVLASELEAKSKNVKRLGDELASSLSRVDRAERLNLVLARSLRSANEETGRLLGLLGI